MRTQFVSFLSLFLFANILLTTAAVDIYDVPESSDQQDYGTYEQWDTLQDWEEDSRQIDPDLVLLRCTRPDGTEYMMCDRDPPFPNHCVVESKGCKAR